MNTTKNIIAKIEEIQDSIKKEVLLLEKKRRISLYKYIGTFIGILSLSIIAALASFGDKLNIGNFGEYDHLLEVIAVFGFSFGGGILSPLIKFGGKNKVAKISLRELIKDTYLAKLDESKLNPKTLIPKE
jgi:hypothetical protein